MKTAPTHLHPESGDDPHDVREELAVTGQCLNGLPQLVEAGEGFAAGRDDLHSVILWSDGDSADCASMVPLVK